MCDESGGELEVGGRLQLQKKDRKRDGERMGGHSSRTSPFLFLVPSPSLVRVLFPALVLFLSPVLVVREFSPFPSRGLVLLPPFP